MQCSKKIFSMLYVCIAATHQHYPEGIVSPLRQNCLSRCDVFLYDAARLLSAFSHHGPFISGESEWKSNSVTHCSGLSFRTLPIVGQYLFTLITRMSIIASVLNSFIVPLYVVIHTVYQSTAISTSFCRCYHTTEELSSCGAKSGSLKYLWPYICYCL